MEETKKIISSRISVRRVQLNLKQADIVCRINEYINQHKDEFPNGKLLSYTNLSHWETGHRNIPAMYSHALAYALECSEAYLYGEDTAEQQKGKAIPHKRVYLYDKQPVFVVFKNKAYADQWGIIDYKRDEIILATRKFIRLSATKKSQYNEIIQEILPLVPYEMNLGDNGREQLINLPQAILEDRVIIKMKSTDPYVTQLYDGIYKHNENRTAFINNNGLVLPYEGINLSYNVYSTGYMTNYKRVKFNKDYRGKINSEDIEDNEMADTFVPEDVDIINFHEEVQEEFLPKDMQEPLYVGRPTGIHNGLSGVEGKQHQSDYYLQVDGSQAGQASNQNPTEEPKRRRGRPRKDEKQKS